MKQVPLQNQLLVCLLFFPDDQETSLLPKLLHKKMRLIAVLCTIQFNFVFLRTVCVCCAHIVHYFFSCLWFHNQKFIIWFVILSDKTNDSAYCLLHDHPRNLSKHYCNIIVPHFTFNFNKLHALDEKYSTISESKTKTIE